MAITPDQLVLNDNWSDLSRIREMPTINRERMYQYRQSRIRSVMRSLDVCLCIMVNPISLRYAIDYRNYALFMSHIPSTYLFFPLEGDFILHNAFDPKIPDQNKRVGQPLAYMYGGDSLAEFAKIFAQEVDSVLRELGENQCRIAIEYVNPSVTQALEERGIEVIDGVLITEKARLIKNEDELACIRWAIAVAEHGADKLKEAMVPGVSEVQLWALLNYANLANNGDWHDGRMLASGPRINPWLQEASDRKIESGDLVGFDTDMVGPMGYFADLSRTFHCGPNKPTKRQREIYQLAYGEIAHNLNLIKPGTRFSSIQKNAFPVPEEFQENAYPCIVHGVGMCDEYPHIHPSFRGELPYEDVIQAGMVLCVESYMGAKGESVGAKLEQQIVITNSGYELLTGYPFDEQLMS